MVFGVCKQTAGYLYYSEFVTAYQNGGRRGVPDKIKHMMFWGNQKQQVESRKRSLPWQHNSDWGSCRQTPFSCCYVNKYITQLYLIHVCKYMTLNEKGSYTLLLQWYFVHCSYMIVTYIFINQVDIDKSVRRENMNW